MADGSSWAPLWGDGAGAPDISHLAAQLEHETFLLLGISMPMTCDQGEMWF